MTPEQRWKRIAGDFALGVAISVCARLGSGHWPSFLHVVLVALIGGAVYAGASAFLRRRGEGRRVSR